MRLAKFLHANSKWRDSQARTAFAQASVSLPANRGDSSGHLSVDETQGGQKKIISPLVNVCC